MTRLGDWMATSGRWPSALLAMTMAVGCASTGALERRVAQLEQELKATREAQGSNAERTPHTRAVGARRPAPATGATEGAAMAPRPTMLREPPYFAYVNFRPPYCDDHDPLCLRIENHLQLPICALRINGQEVQGVEMGRCIARDGVAYVPIPPPGGRITIEALAYHAVRLIAPARGAAARSLPTPHPLYRCQVRPVVGTVGDMHNGPSAWITPMDCGSLAMSRGG